MHELLLLEMTLIYAARVSDVAESAKGGGIRDSNGDESTLEMGVFAAFRRYSTYGGEKAIAHVYARVCLIIGDKREKETRSIAHRPASRLENPLEDINLTAREPRQRAKL